jgi:hypothetical protein
MNETTELAESITELPEASPHRIVPLKLLHVENKPDPAALERHNRKCQVCRHPDREDIESDYIQWKTPWLIAHQFKIPVRSIYRHCEALGLTSVRRANLQGALERIVERGAEVSITGNTVIRAVKAICCLKDGNRWQEPAPISDFKAPNAPNLYQKEGSHLLEEGAHESQATGYKSPRVADSNRHAGD